MLRAAKQDSQAPWGSREAGIQSQECSGLADGEYLPSGPRETGSRSQARLDLVGEGDDEGGGLGHSEDGEIDQWGPLQIPPLQKGSY